MNLPATPKFMTPESTFDLLAPTKPSEKYLAPESFVLVAGGQADPTEAKKFADFMNKTKGPCPSMRLQSIHELNDEVGLNYIVTVFAIDISPQPSDPSETASAMRMSSLSEGVDRRGS